MAEWSVWVTYNNTSEAALRKDVEMTCNPVKGEQYRVWCKKCETRLGNFFPCPGPPTDGRVERNLWKLTLVNKKKHVLLQPDPSLSQETVHELLVRHKSYDPEQDKTKNKRESRESKIDFPTDFSSNGTTLIQSFLKLIVSRSGYVVMFGEDAGT